MTLPVAAGEGLVRPAGNGSSEPPITHRVLPNGLEVVVIEDHRAPLAIHMIWYRVGSADEAPGASGAAHFLEHLMFKATDRLDVGEFSRTVAAKGGSDNAFTSLDYTAYFQRVAADRIGLMMEMEADRMVNLRLTPEVVATEREVILEERSQRSDNEPAELLREQMMASLYRNHRYGIPVIGWRHEMEKLGMDEVGALYRRFYTPDNAIVVVAGDVTPETVFALAEQHYGGLEPGKAGLAANIRPQEPPHNAARRVHLRDDRVAQPVFLRIYAADARASGNQHRAAAQRLLASLLGGDRTAALQRTLVFERKLAVDVHAGHRSMARDGGIFRVVAVPADGISVEELEDAIDREISDFFERGVSQEHLQRIKAAARASRVYARDSVQSVAQRYGRGLASGLSLQDIAEWPGILQSITAEDIIAEGRRILRPERSVTGWLEGTGEGA